MNEGTIPGLNPNSWKYYSPRILTASNGSPTQPIPGTGVPSPVGRWARIESGLIMCQYQIFFGVSPTRGVGDTYLFELPTKAKRYSTDKTIPQIISTGLNYHAQTGNAYNQPMIMTLSKPYTSNSGNEDYFCESFIGGYGLTFGSSTIASGSTSRTITHNLGFTPTASDISITWANAGTLANTQGHYWISNITSTQFTVNIREAAGGGTPAIVQGNVGTSVGLTVSAVLGASPTAGNILVAVHGANQRPTGGMTTPAAGWTTIQDAAVGTNASSVTIYARVVAGGEGTTYTATNGGSGISFLHVYEFSGAASTVAGAFPVGNSSKTDNIATATSAATPTITPTAGYGGHVVAGIFWQGGVTSAQSANNSYNIVVASNNRGASAEKTLGTISGTTNTTFSWTTSRPSGTVIAAIQGAAPVNDLAFSWKVRAEPNSTGTQSYMLQPTVPWVTGLIQDFFVQVIYEPDD